MLPLIHDLKSEGVLPQVFVIHLGKIDLGYRSAVSLLSEMLDNVQVLKQLFPGVVIIWSNMVTRCVWRCVSSSGKMDNNNVLTRSVVPGYGTAATSFLL